MIGGAGLPAWPPRPIHPAKHRPETVGARPPLAPRPHSYLGYGLMAGRAAVLSEEATAANGEGHPCVPLGHAGSYEYAGKTMAMRPHPVRAWGGVPGAGWGAGAGWLVGGRLLGQGRAVVPGCSSGRAPHQPALWMYAPVLPATAHPNRCACWAPFPPCPPQDGPSQERCERVVLSALKHQAECGAPQLQCTFNGAWGGPRVPKVGGVGGRTGLQDVRGLRVAEHAACGNCRAFPHPSIHQSINCFPPCRCFTSPLTSGTAPPMRVGGAGAAQLALACISSAPAGRCRLRLSW